jgi:hypothetical protein
MKHKMSLAALFFFLVTTASLSGCASSQAYEGEKLPPERVALIKGSSHIFGTTVSITAIDGKDMRWTSGEIQALPGDHELDMHLMSGVYMFYSYARAKVSFTAKAGHVYRVEGKMRQGKLTGVWVVDEADDSIVGGKKP